MSMSGYFVNSEYMIQPLEIREQHSPLQSGIRVDTFLMKLLSCQPRVTVTSCFVYSCEVNHLHVRSTRAIANRKITCVLILSCG